MTLGSIQSTDITSPSNKKTNSNYYPSKEDSTEGIVINYSAVNEKIKTSDTSTENTEMKPADIAKIYPQLSDTNEKEGKTLILIKSACSDAKNALGAFGEPDLNEVRTHLFQVAATMKKAHSLTEFNESLGAVVSYIRRATLSFSIDELNLSALNALVSVLNALSLNPMLDLYEASELIDKLSDEGWHGELADTKTLIAALFGDADTESSELMAELSAD